MAQRLKAIGIGEEEELYLFFCNNFTKIYDIFSCQS